MQSNRHDPNMRVNLHLFAFGVLSAGAAAGAAAAIIDFVVPKNEPSLLRWLVPSVVGLAVAAFAFYAWRRWINAYRQHAVDCMDLSQKLGAIFTDFMSLDEVANRTRIPAEELYDLKPSHRRGFLGRRHPYCNNVMEAVMGKSSILVADFHQEPMHYTTALIILRYPEPQALLPDFTLQPSSILVRFLSQPTTDPAATEFSKIYSMTVRPEDEKKVHNLFRSAAYRYFAQHPGWTIKARCRCLIITQHLECAGKDRSDFVTQALDILAFMQLPTQLSR